MSDVISLTIAAILTLATFSFVFKYSKFFRVAEHMLAAIIVGNTGVLAIKNLRSVALTPIITRGDLVPLPAIVVGLLVFARLSKRYHWLSRFPSSLLVGIGTGLVMGKIAYTAIMSQIVATIQKVSIDSLLTLIFLVVPLVYFLFVQTTGSVDRTQATLRRVARPLILLMCGITFANFVMARTTAFLGRIMFLMFEWLPALMGK